MAYVCNALDLPNEQIHCTINEEDLATVTRGTPGASVPCWTAGWLAAFPAPSVVFAGVAEGLFSAARPPQAFPGAFVKHRSKGGQ